MNFFARKGRTLLIAAMLAAAFAAGARAQNDTADVPFVVNVDAEVRAVRDGDALTETMQVAAEEESVLRLPLLGSSTGAVYSAQGRANTPTITNAPGGKITLNLPPQSYKSAEVSLYAVNGRQILHSKAAASEAGKRLSKRGAAPGVYLLSVKGSGGNAFTSRFAHSGGELNIAVVFGGGNVSSPDRMPKKAAGESWTVRVSAEGYDDSVFTLRPVAGENPLVEVTLKVTLIKYKVTVSSAGTGAAGGGDYAEGTEVSIRAGTAPSGKEFKNWTTTSSGVTLANANSAATTFIMPANAVTVTANFDYESVTIGGKKWMKKNLNIETTTGSWCYENSPDSCAKYGRLYTWEAAKAACQLVGWRLPTRAEWDNLVTAAGGSSTAGKKLKSVSGWNNNGNDGTDDFGFSALPGGGRNYSDGSFNSAGRNGCWWTAEEYSSGSAYYRYMLYDYDNVLEHYYYEDYAWSVRCVGDD
ncbi:hypothetical protein R80B4_00049 [Fibrobacteres bacterium R8-0-B4]